MGMKEYKVYEKIHQLAGFGDTDEFLGLVEARDDAAALNKGRRLYGGMDRSGVPARKRNKLNFFVKEVL